MCAFGARPGSYGPHVGAVPPTAGIVTLPALRAHRFPYLACHQMPQINHMIIHRRLS